MTVIEKSTGNSALPLVFPLERCPLCGGTRNQPAPEPHDVREYRYATWIAEQAAQEGTPLPGALPDLLRCQDCDARFFAAWVDPALQRRAIFGNRQPQHPTGQSVLKGKGGFLAPSRQAVWSWLHETLGGIDSLAEFGCPGWGFMEIATRPAMSLLGGLAVANGEATVLGRELRQLAGARSGLGGLMRRALGLSVRKPVSRAYLIPADGVIESFWGEGCKLDGEVSCRSAVSGLYGAKVLSLGQVPVQGPVDLMVALNVLDHSHRAHEIIAGLAPMARHLFIYGHRYVADQCVLHHVFAPTPESFKHLRGLGWELMSYSPKPTPHEVGALLRRMH